MAVRLCDDCRIVRERVHGAKLSPLADTGRARSRGCTVWHRYCETPATGNGKLPGCSHPARGAGYGVVAHKGHRRPEGKPPVSDSITTVAAVSPVPDSPPAPAPDSSEQYDHLDLFLSQG
jgi:hypothetical protein